MKINPDFVVFITMIGSAIIGYAFGRFESHDSYVKGYKRGKAVQAALAAQTANKILENLGER